MPKATLNSLGPSYFMVGVRGCFPQGFAATAIAAQHTGPFDCLFFDGDRISAPAQLDILLPKLFRPALLLADNALSHPDQIAGYLDRVSGLPQVSHIVLPVAKGLSVAHLPEC